MNIRKHIHLIAIASALVLSACARSAPQTPTPEAAAEPAQSLVIAAAWSRSTAEIEAGTGIVYMTITNNTDRVETLVAAKTSAAEVVEFHIHVQDANGVMRMRMVDGGRIEIPAGETVILEPGGLHLMLINLIEPLEAGASYPLTLKFERAGEWTLYVPVADDAPDEAAVMSLFAGGYEALTTQP